MNNNYSEDYVSEEKRFRITRGMLILATIILLVIIIIVILVVNAINRRKPEYVISDFKKLESRMSEEAPNFLIQKGIELGDQTYTIDLKSLLVENGGGIDSRSVKAAKVCDGYVEASLVEEELYESYISCYKDKTKLYETEGYKKKTKSTTTKAKDTEKPTIIINGNKEITVEQNGTYNDEGATATDNIDGDITAKIQTDSNVNLSAVGEYRVTYTVTDSSGNRAEDSRVVTVIAPATTTAAPITTTRATTKKQSGGSKTNNTTRRQTTARVTTPPTLTLKGKSYISLEVGQSYIEPGYSAKDARQMDITSSVAVSGSVNTNAAGTYTIRYSVTDAYGNYASTTRTVRVNAKYVAVQRLTISPNGATISVGKSITLSVLFYPTNASNKSITWSSSNSSVATVSNGVVTGKKKGKVTITARGADGKSITSTITVK